MAEQATEETVADAPVSVEDKIAAKFLGPEAEPQEAEAAESDSESDPTQEAGDAGDDALTDQDNTSEPEYVEVEVAGEKYKLPPSIKEVIDREAERSRRESEFDATRRIIDEQQKQIALHGQQRAFEESVSSDYALLRVMESHIRQMSAGWESLTPDQKLELQEFDRRRTHLAQTLDSKRREFTEKLNAERSKIFAERDEWLKKKLPDGRKAEIEKYLASRGVSSQAVGSMSSLEYEIVDGFMKWTHLQSEKSSAVLKAQQKQTKVIKPLSRKPMPDKTKQLLNYRKVMNNPNASREQKQAALKDRIAAKFGA